MTTIRVEKLKENNNSICGWVKIVQNILYVFNQVDRGCRGLHFSAKSYREWKQQVNHMFI